MSDDDLPYLGRLIDLIQKGGPHMSREDIEADLRRWLKPPNYPDPMEPPWKACPGIDRWPSIGWRMGGGEDYLAAFTKWFRVLTPEKQAAYMEANPEPEAFRGMYEIILSRAD